MIETDQIYSKFERRLFILLGVICVVAAVWVTHLYFEARVINMSWNETFTTPKEFWSAVPRWEWRSIYG